MSGWRALALLISLTVLAFAKEPKLKLTWIQAAPGDFVLAGKWASQRIVVTGKLADGSLHDVTGQTRFKSSNSRVAAVSKAGVVTPVAGGEANIELNANGKKQKLHVTVKLSRTPSAAFATEVRPLLSKLGCNTAQCHGAARGKGGLRLSLFGGDGEADFEALTKAGGGRRINRAEPRDSLLYLKATGELGHPGAKAGAREADILLTWLNGGAPWSNLENAQIAGLKLYPDEPQFQKGQTQRLLVTAIFSDGQVRDVTADAGYHTSNPKIASVTSDGLVKAEDAGDAAIVVTYQRKAGVLRLAIPQPGPKPFPKLEANNRIDELVYRKLKAMGVPPSPLASDEAFLRRVYLDVIGILPAAGEGRAFLAKPDRAQLIDSLLGREEYNDFWALKWGDLLRIKSEFPVRVWPKAVAVYYQWVHDSLAANKPYDQFARELVTATGSNFRVGPANFVRAVPSKDARTLGETTALVFMGERIGCARCHAHPQESWTLDDDLGLGAFFARVNYKATQEWKEEIVYTDFRATLKHPRPRAVAEPRLPIGSGSGPRRVFRAGELQSHPGMEGRDRLYGLPRDLEAPAHPRRGGAAASRRRLARESGRRGRSARATGGMADGAGQSLLRQSNREPHLVLAAGARHHPGTGRSAAHQSAGQSRTAGVSGERTDGAPVRTAPHLPPDLEFADLPTRERAQPVERARFHPVLPLPGKAAGRRAEAGRHLAVDPDQREVPQHHPGAVFQLAGQFSRHPDLRRQHGVQFSRPVRPASARYAVRRGTQ